MVSMATYLPHIIELSYMCKQGLHQHLWLWGGDIWVGGIWGHGGFPTHVHMHIHAHTHTHTKINMLRNCKWPPPWRQPCLSCLTYMHVCLHMRAHAGMCVCMRTCMGGAPQISKNAIRLERIEIFRFRLKIWNLWRIPHPWVGVFFGGWVGGWMGGLVGRKM